MQTNDLDLVFGVAREGGKLLVSCAHERSEMNHIFDMETVDKAEDVPAACGRLAEAFCRKLLSVPDA